MSGRNKIIGLVTMPVSFAYCQSIINERNDLHLYNVNKSYNNPIKKRTNVDLKDRSFYSGIALSIGGLFTLASGSLLCLAPGVAMTLVTLPMLVYAETREIKKY